LLLWGNWYTIITFDVLTDHINYSCIYYTSKQLSFVGDSFLCKYRYLIYDFLFNVLYLYANKCNFLCLKEANKKKINFPECNEWPLGVAIRITFARKSYTNGRIFLKLNM
jgi:hypothetical protein